MDNRGRFSGRVHAEWCDNGRDMIILRELTYTDLSGVVWVAPAMSMVDGASIPRICWRVIGSPFVGRYRRSSVIHDVYCQTRALPWRMVHSVFNEMMGVDGVPFVKRFFMAKAVWFFGPKWRYTFKPMEGKTCEFSN